MFHLDYHKTVILLVLSILFFQKSWASHIVGGEPQLLHLEGNRYRVGIVLYFDDINGERDALDLDLKVHAYSKTSEDRIESFTIALKENFIIPFSQPECAISELRTRRMYYWSDKTLSPEKYSDPSGYYLVWERCCRNAIIDNINEPDQIGQAFYMEFAAIRNPDGSQFLNSTPSFFEPVSDYPCVGQDFRLDFGSTDPDGDSLAYRLVTPLKGFSSDDLLNRIPPASPAPYPEVEFIAGIGIENMIPGTPPLTIDRQTGLLTVKPSVAGLFVFAVAVDEFRNGIKIGETRREYQVLVLDCPPAEPPSVRFRQDGKTTFYNEGDTIFFNLDENTCGDLEITDRSGNSEIVAVLTSTNFTSTGSISVEQHQGTITNPTDILTFNVCFPRCPVDEDAEPFVLDVVVLDNTCSVPLTDTLKVLVGNFTEKIELFLPNVFTPNGDGFNDTFGIPESIKKSNKLLCLEPLFKMEIYNRWGRKVFENTSQNQDWDGKGFPAGIYFYQIQYNQQVFKGWVSLLKNE